jgi:predicted cupin superfamily sugar epimerase
MTAEDIIDLLGMRPLPGEGGYFAETYRSAHGIPTGSLPDSYRGERAFGTAIYYLLTSETFSALHRLPGDEVYHFYLGDSVEMLQLKPDLTGERIVLGPDIKNGMRPQAVVAGGVWQGSRLFPGGKWALIGTTMSPGFEFEDYTPGIREALLSTYPAYRELICALTRGSPPTPPSTSP